MLQGTSVYRPIQTSIKPGPPVWVKSALTTRLYYPPLMCLFDNKVYYTQNIWQKYVNFGLL